MFDSSHGRTCLHYAAYYGHAESLRAILSAAKSAPVSQSWSAKPSSSSTKLLLALSLSLLMWSQMQGIRALRQRAGRHGGDAAAPCGEAGVAPLRPRPARERSHRVRLKWRIRVSTRIPPSLSLSSVRENAFLCHNSSCLLRKPATFDSPSRARAPFFFLRFPGSTPLHLAARGGNLDCVRQLLSWGADRLQRDSVG